MNLDNTLLVTHQGCMDGSTCAILFLRAGGKRKNVYFTLPGHDSTDELVHYLADTHEGPIIVADASISLELAERLDKRNNNILILDHHASAIPLNKFDWCEIDEKNTRAGGKMFYDYLTDRCSGQQGFDVRIMEDLVLAADDYDRWIKQIPVCEDLVILHEQLGSELFIDRFLKISLLEFTVREEYVISLAKHRNDAFIERKKEDAVVITKDVDGHSVKIAIVEAGTQQSRLGNALCTDPAIGADIAVLINSRSVSFRGSQDCPVDLSKVAKLNLGGGHAKAAGAGLGNILGKDFVEMVFDKIRWEAE